MGSAKRAISPAAFCSWNIRGLPAGHRRVPQIPSARTEIESEPIDRGSAAQFKGRSRQIVTVSRARFAAKRQRRGFGRNSRGTCIPADRAPEVGGRTSRTIRLDASTPPAVGTRAARSSPPADTGGGGTRRSVNSVPTRSARSSSGRQPAFQAASVRAAAVATPGGDQGSSSRPQERIAAPAIDPGRPERNQGRFPNAF